MGEVAASSLTVESLVESHAWLAKSLAKKCKGQGVDDDDLESEAMLRLFYAARSFRPRDHGDAEAAFRHWATLCITRGLGEKVKAAPLAHLAGVPGALRSAAIACDKATHCLRARGIARPSPDQIAGEAMIEVELVEEVLDIPGLIVRQDLVAWCEAPPGGSRDGEPGLWPAFGAEPGFSPQTPCSTIHPDPIPAGSLLCCMVCHGTGVEGHKALRRDPEKDPRPEKRRSVPKLDVPPLVPGESMSRRQRRQKARQDPTCTDQH